MTAREVTWDVLESIAFDHPRARIELDAQGNGWLTVGNAHWFAAAEVPAQKAAR